MKIEKLTDNKIRIIIKTEEIAAHKINLRKLSVNDNNAALIQIILKEAEKQVGFDFKNSKILIDAISTVEDYVIFTLTKYKNDINFNNSKEKNKYNSKITSIKNSKNAIYKFKTFDEFCNLCTYCSSTNLSDLKSFAKKISLYEYNNSYYLVLLEINNKFAFSDLFYNSISEFSTFVSDSIIFKSTLDEYGKIIFKSNAINHGIKYFSNI